MSLADVVNQVGAAFGLVAGPGGAYVAARLRKLKDAVRKAEDAAAAAKTALASAEAARQAAEHAASRVLPRPQVDPQEIQMVVDQSVDVAVRRVKSQGPDRQELDKAVTDHYEGTVKRAMKVEWQNWLDVARVKMDRELDRKFDELERSVSDKVETEVDSAVKKAMRRSKPDDVDPFVQQQIDNFERRLKALEEQFVEAAKERSESWRAFATLVSDMREIMDDMRSALRTKPPRG